MTFKNTSNGESCLQGKVGFNFFNSNSRMSLSAIHNGLQYVKAQMKFTKLEEQIKQSPKDLQLPFPFPTPSLIFV